MISQNVLRWLSPMLWGIAVAVLCACTATTPTVNNIPTTAVASGGDADKLLVVDCLLPGQIRKLGQQATYLSARRPIKTTVGDCEIRGGEYVAYDRATYTAALRIWLPQADAGDPVAQAYVGEIYERGLGVPPDYAKAAQWYRKAAEQGNPRAQVNLGTLYERGKGVARNQTTAVNWYRKASGLSGDTLAFSSSVAALQADVRTVRAERDELRQELKLRTQEADLLRAQLNQTEQQMQRRRQRLNTTERELDQTRRQLQKQKTAPQPSAAPSGSVGTRQLETRLATQKQQLASQRQELTYLQQEAERQQARLKAELRAAKSRAKGLETSVATQASERQSLQQQVDFLQGQLKTYETQLSARRQELETQQASLQQLRQQVGSQGGTAAPQDNAEVQRSQSQLQARDQELAQAREQVANLETEVRRREGTLQELEKTRTDAAFATREQQSLQQQVDYLQGQLRNYRDQLSGRKQQLETQQANLRQARQELDKQRSSASSRNSAEVQRLQRQLEQKDNELTRTREQVALLETDVKSREQELEQLSSLREDATHGAQEQESLQQQVGYLQGQLVKYRDQLNARKQELERERQNVQQAHQELKRQQQSKVVQESAESRELRQQLDTKNSELEQTREQVVILESEVKARQKELADLKKLSEKKVAFRGSKPAATVAAATPSLPKLNFGRYYALVIGNNSYQQFPNLQTAVSDAGDVANVLRSRYGFQTQVLRNANRYAILKALNEFRAKLTENDNFLLYYAGHGELDRSNGRGHWLPVDAEPSSTANWISNVQITDILNAMSAKHAMVIADSCYSGTLTRAVTTSTEGGRSAEKRNAWLKAMIKTRSRTVLTSGGLKPVLDSGGGGHSVFANVLLEVLESNREVLEGPILYWQVSKQVKIAAARLNAEQDPSYSPLKFAGDLGAPFFFNPVN